MTQKNALIIRRAGLIMTGDRLVAARDQGTEFDEVRRKVTRSIGDILQKEIDDDIARVERIKSAERATVSGKNRNKGDRITMVRIDAFFQKTAAAQQLPVLQPAINPLRVLPQNEHRETPRVTSTKGPCEFCLNPDDVPLHRPPVHFKHDIFKEWICAECDREQSDDEDFYEDDEGKKDDEGSKGRLSGTLNDSHNPHPYCLRIPICCITLTHTLPRCRIT